MRDLAGRRCHRQPTGRNNFQLLLVDRSDIGSGDFDAIFNYDRVEWNEWESITCMDPLNPNLACPPFPAIVGFRSNTSAFEFPRSGGSAFLDSNTSAGLIHGSFGGLQLGRYRFEFRSGSASTGATGNGVINGVVRRGGTGAPLAGASVQLCSVIAGCQVTTSNSAGAYSFMGLGADSYIVTAFPPAGVPNDSASLSVLGFSASETRSVDVLLPLTFVPPPGTITPSATAPNGHTLVSWDSPLTLRIVGCPGGTAMWELRKNNVLLRAGSMTEGPAGTYTASTPALKPASGQMRVAMVIACPDGSTQPLAVNIYIDPSGVVRDTTGTLLTGATVVLFRSDSSSGPFTQVPDGSAIMSPSNRKNPDVTDAFWSLRLGRHRRLLHRAGHEGRVPQPCEPRAGVRRDRGHDHPATRDRPRPGAGVPGDLSRLHAAHAGPHPGHP